MANTNLGTSRREAVLFLSSFCIATRAALVRRGYYVTTISHAGSITGSPSSSASYFYVLVKLKLLLPLNTKAGQISCAGMVHVQTAPWPKPNMFAKNQFLALFN